MNVTSDPILYVTPGDRRERGERKKGEKKKAVGGVGDELPRSYAVPLIVVSSTPVSVCALHAEFSRELRAEVYEAFGNGLGLCLNGNATLKEVCKMPLHVIIFDH